MTRREEVPHVNGISTSRLRKRVAPKERKERVTIQLSVELTEAIRDAVFWTPGATLSGFVEEALKAQLDKAEKKHGGRFASRSAPLKAGRPLKR